MDIVSSLSQEFFLKESPFFLSEAAAFIDMTVFLTNEFAIRPALGENLAYSNTSSGKGSYKTICRADASCLALTSATPAASSHVATPTRSVAYLCVHTTACMVSADCWAPRCHATLAHVFSQLRTSGASQSHHSSTSSTDVLYNSQAEGEGSSFRSSSAAVQLAWQRQQVSKPSGIAPHASHAG